MSSESQARKIDVCLTPALYHLHDEKNCIAVIIDIVRATTSMCTAFAYGVNHIKPLKSIVETFAYREKGYLLAGEKNAYKIDGFDFGNSPLEFKNPDLENKKIAFVTTNGTKSLNLAKECKQVVLGAFINYEVLIEYLLNQNEDILLFCAGSENNVASEDVLFAGKVATALLESGRYKAQRDAVGIACTFYNTLKDNMENYITQHTRLTKRLDFLANDIHYCFSDIQFKVLPTLQDDILINNL